MMLSNSSPLALVSIALFSLLLSSSIVHGAVSPSSSNTPTSVPKLKVHNETAPSHKPFDHFVKRVGENLEVDGKPFIFRSINAPDLFQGSGFEARDTFRTIGAFKNPVTRSYVLAKIVSKQLDPEGAIVLGWDDVAQDWKFNETNLQSIDYVFAEAGRHGVKMIVPIVNEDYGTEAFDYFGNFVDLITYRYNTSGYTASQEIDFFTDGIMKDAFKKLITTFLTRKNTVNGKIWGEDNTILAWETGNEMNWASKNLTNNRTLHIRPPPANWTVDIAAHIKSLAPKQLVMDGSFARVYDPVANWPIEALRSPYIDIFSWHAYGDGDIKYFKNFSDYVTSFDKVFVVGEFGFFSKEELFRSAWRNLTSNIAGALIWSMRPHDDQSGFKIHGEGSGIFSYHFPGWRNQTSPSFDVREYGVTHSIWEAGYRIVGKKPPLFPVPGVPLLRDVSNSTNGTRVSWRGAAWAEHYQLWAASLNAPFFELVGKNLRDNVDANTLSVPVMPADSERKITYSPKPIPHPTSFPTWKDPKWHGGHAPDYQHRLVGGGFEKKAVGRHYDHHHHHALAQRLLEKKAEKEEEKEDGEDEEEEEDDDDENENEEDDDNFFDFGTWYLLRGVSVDGIPGPFSQPIYITASEGK